MKSMSKAELMQTLGIKKYPTLYRLLTRVGICVEKGQQLFTPGELHKIFYEWDYSENEN